VVCCCSRGCLPGSLRQTEAQADLLERAELRGSHSLSAAVLVDHAIDTMTFNACHHLL
jgi:hypothetical protein